MKIDRSLPLNLQLYPEKKSAASTATPSANLKSQNNRVGGKQSDLLARMDEIEKGAKAFESYFMQTLLKEMRKTVPTGKGHGFGAELYQSMFDEAIAKEMTESGGIGLSHILAEKLSKTLKFLEQASDKGME